YESGQYGLASSEFREISSTYREDPISAYATLYSGMACYQQGAFRETVEALQLVATDRSVAREARDRAQYFLGMAYLRLGELEAGRALLEPLASRLANEEAGELWAVLAHTAVAGGDASFALACYDRFFTNVSANLAERAYAKDRASSLVTSISLEKARELYGVTDKETLSAALLGERLLADARGKGDRRLASMIVAETAEARDAAGLAKATPTASAARAGAVRPDLLGGLLPLSGARRLIGEQAMRGLAIATGAFADPPPAPMPAPASDWAQDAGSGKNVFSPFSVTVLDSGRTGGASSAFNALADQGALAIVGLGSEEEEEDTLITRADERATPLILLNSGEAARGPSSPWVFHVIVPVDQRARALARYAWKQGARVFAVLAPDIAYGKRAAQAFADEATKLGGRVAANLTYPKGATTFVEPVGKLSSLAIDALFVPDVAARLELIAPQLAASDLVVRTPGRSKEPRRGQPIVLCATAEALSQRFIRSAGRYAEGAILAPGFYPDDADSRLRPFVTRFRAAYGGEDPTYLDAYSYDSALVARTAVQTGAKEPETLAAAIASKTFAGLTGDIRFDSDGLRADAGVLYTVVIEEGQYAVRALRP
ncbi:MAG: penicillin-binding protein activator, partial [Pseudomonadota bacterium]